MSWPKTSGGQNTTCSCSPTAALLREMAHVWTSHTLGQARQSWWPVQDPVTSGRGGDAPPQHWLCTPWSRNGPASTIPCTMQRCGGYRSPAQLCPPGSPGSSRRFPYPGLASTGHTSPAGRRGERVSAWLLAGAFRVRDGALPSKG